MEHGIGSGSPHLVQARLAEGVMVRRLSVASLDSGAESPVYGDEPLASAGRGNPAVRPPWPGGGLIVSDEPAWLPAPPAATLPSTQQVSSDQVGTGAPRLTTSCDTLVVDQQSGRWYVKDIRASTQVMGAQ
jgi:hypothetical protein